MSVISSGRPVRKEVTEQVKKMKKDWDEKKRNLAEERKQKASAHTVAEVAHGHWAI